MEFPSSISKETINQLPLMHYEGPITLVKTDAQMAKALNNLRQESLIGFDTESRPAFRKGQSYPPALVQLAGAETVYLFQLGNFQSLEGLMDLFHNPSLTKVGVAIKDDIEKLRDLADFIPAGFLELSAFSQKLGIVNTGLRSLAAIFLKGRISKGPQTTNWSRKHLTKAQIRYAATDAWVCRELYQHLAFAVNASGE